MINFLKFYYFSFPICDPECKYEITSNQNVTSGQIVIGNDIQGVYYCDWYLRADNDKSVLLSFQNHEISMHF